MKIPHVAARGELNLLAIALFLVIVTISFETLSNNTFTSQEVHFTDMSQSGMKILPASCASSPVYYHGYLFQTAPNHEGYKTLHNDQEQGITKFSIPVCVTNRTGQTYFVPAMTIDELNAFKNVQNLIPGLQVY